MKLSKSLAFLALACGVGALANAQGNQSKQVAKDGAPRIVVSEAPAYDCGGPDRMESIAGKVTGVAPAQYRLAIYAQACNGVLYVQPTVAAPLTSIGQEGTFEVYIHLGQNYYVLLVPPSYKPQAELTSVPQKGGDILVVVKIRGRGAPADGEKK